MTNNDLEVSMAKLRDCVRRESELNQELMELYVSRNLCGSNARVPDLQAGSSDRPNHERSSSLLLVLVGVLGFALILLGADAGRRAGADSAALRKEQSAWVAALESHSSSSPVERRSPERVVSSTSETLDVITDGYTWRRASRASKQALCATLSRASVHPRSPGFFYDAMQAFYSEGSHGVLRVEVAVVAALAAAVR